MRQPPMAFTLLFLAGCATPTLTALSPAAAPPHGLVAISGTDLIGASIVWDAGQVGETVIPGAFLAASMFSVPPGATQGLHPIALRNSKGQSAPMNLTVSAPVPWTTPRIDHVGMVYPSFQNNQVGGILYVQGADIDVGAVVQIDGADAATAAHRGLQHPLPGVNLQILGYPIYHYVSLIVSPPTPPAPGTTVNLRVRNLDGGMSPSVPYTFPTSADTVDSDGDNLPDLWEINGYDADGNGTVDVDLPGLGADPYRPDLFLEVDIMTGLANPPSTAAGGVFDLTSQLFAAAPILNWGGQPGIHLVIDSGGTVPFAQTMGFQEIDPTLAGPSEFLTVKSTNFDNATRGRIYHYAIWGNALTGGYSGVSDAFLGVGGQDAGDDFLVSFDDFSASYQTLRNQVETLAHEFGHGLGQRHGGDTHSQYKPNYWTVMSYAWQLRSGRDAAWRAGKPTCAPIYWADPTATEVGGVAPAAVTTVLDYSHGMGPTLVENTGTLDETTGVCGPAVRWNADNDTTDDNISANADDNASATETLNDFGNWRSLDYRGPEINGVGTP